MNKKMSIYIIFIFLIIPILPIVVIFNYWHPNYSDNFVTSKYFIEHGKGYYEVVSMNNKKGYLRGDTIYDIQGQFIKKTEYRALFFSEEYVSISPSITKEGAHLLYQDKFDSQYLYVYDFYRDSMLYDFLEIKLNNYITDSFSKEFQQKLKSVGFELPQKTIPPNKDDFGKDYTKYNRANDRYRVELDSMFTTTVESFIIKNKDDICSDYNKIFLKKKGLAFSLSTKLSSELKTKIDKVDLLFIEDVIDENIEHPLVNIQRTGRAIKGPKFAWKFFPMWDGWEYTYFYKLNCDGNNFYFKGDYVDYIIIDYKVTNDKIYFALSKNGATAAVNIYEYKRKR